MKRLRTLSRSFSTLVLLLAGAVLAQADYLQTGLSSTGTVHLVRATVQDDILTISLLYEEPRGVVSFPFDDVFLVAGRKKYPVLKDENGRFLAAPESKVGSGEEGRYGVTLLSGQDRVVWFQFPCPQGSDRALLQVPDALPFEIDLKS